MNEVEKKFFRFCMKNLQHTETNYMKNLDCVSGMSLRADYLMMNCITDFCKIHNVSVERILNITWKWNLYGIFEWIGGLYGAFYPERFPMRYALLVPSRTIRKCGFLIPDEIKYGYNQILIMKGSAQKTIKDYNIEIGKYYKTVIIKYNKYLKLNK